MLFPLLALAAALSHAQTPPDPSREVQRPGAEKSSQEEQERAAAQARQSEEAAGDAVTWEQVMARPDDLELNYAFARAQVRRGDVKGASATLERILLLAPKNTRVRLFYALVLLRLDNAAEAARELEAVLKADPSQAEAKAYLKQANRRLKKTRLSGRAAAGVQYDSNRNAAPMSGQRLLANVPVSLAPASRRQGDPSFIGMVSVDGRRDLGFQAGHEAFLSGTYYRSDQSRLKTLALQAHALEAGVALKRRSWTVTPSFVIDHVMLGGDTFLRDRGAALRLETRRRRGVVVYLEARGVYNDYAPTAQVRTAEERNGPQWDGTLGVWLPLTPRWRAGASYNHADKSAVRRYNAFLRDVGRVEATWLPGKGMFVNASAALGRDKYETADTAVAVSARTDETVRLGAGFGAPLGGLHPWLKDLTWTATYEHFRSRSNLISYDYFNNRIASMLTYRWEAGF